MRMATPGTMSVYHSWAKDSKRKGRIIMEFYTCARTACYAQDDQNKYYLEIVEKGLGTGRFFEIWTEDVEAFKVGTKYVIGIDESKCKITPERESQLINVINQLVKALVALQDVHENKGK